MTEPDLVGAENCWRPAVAMPRYRPGVGGWRREIVPVGNDLAALGLNGVASALNSTFYG